MSLIIHPKKMICKMLYILLKQEKKRTDYASFFK